MEHVNTKYEHSSTNVPVENRGQFNYCSLCNGWFPRQDEPHKVTLQCNECGKKRKVSPNGTYNDRCPKCGGVDWDVL